MGQLGETKHRKVLRKSKKQWITVGLTSAALGITGLVHNGELVSAEEAQAVANEQVSSELEEEAAEVVETETTDESTNEADVTEVTLETLLDSYANQAAQEDADVESLLASFAEEASVLEDVVVEEAVAQLEARLAEEASATSAEAEEETETVEETAEVAEPVEEEPVVEEEQSVEQETEAVEETVAVAEPVKEEPAEEVEQVQTRTVRPQMFAAQAVSTPQVQDANLDVYLGEKRHVDGTPMEKRTVEIELDQTSIRDVIMDKIKAHRRNAYEKNIQFVYEDYNRPKGASASTNRLQTAAREAGYHTVDEYVNAFEWSDRLEDYSIQRATELLTTGYHSGNYSHYRPDRHEKKIGNKRIHHEYRNADGSIHHSAPENIHANRNDNIHTAFKAWADREYDALARSKGAYNYKNAHLHSILNPVYTIYGGSSVTLAGGQSGARANRANVLIGSKWNSANHTAASAPRIGTYQVDVLTKKNGPKLPGEVTPSEQVDVEVSIDYNSIEEFNPDVAEGKRVLHQKGKKGLEVNGVVKEQPIDEIWHVGLVREVLPQADLVETFDVNAAFNSTVETNTGRDGYVLKNPVDNVVVERVSPQSRTIVHGPQTQKVSFDTVRKPNFELELGQENIVTVGQDGTDLYNPLTGEFVKTEAKPVTQVIEVGVEQREVSFNTVRKPVVGLGAERVIQSGVNGVAYFDKEGNEYEDRRSAPVDEIIEYPAIEKIEPIPASERIAIVGLDKETTVEEGAEGLTYYDEQGNSLDVPENVAPVTPVVHYPAVAAAVPFETERVAVVGLKEERIAVEGVEGVEYQDEDGNALGSDEDVAPINEVIEYPALEVLRPFETERRAVIDLEEERVVVEGKDGIHYEDEDGKMIESDNQTDPVTQIIKYPAVLSSLPFETEEVETEELEAGERKVITKGEEGVAYFDEDGELFEEVTEPVNEVVLVGVAKLEQEQAPVQKTAPQATQTKAKALVNRNEAIQTVTGLTNLSREERKQVIEAIESTDSQDKVDALVAAAQELDNARDKEVEAKAGQRLPDTATASWALGLIGMTSVLSGLGIKKFKK